MTLRSFAGTLAAFAAWHYVDLGRLAAAAWVVVGVAGAALLEYLAGIVHRRLSAAPPRPGAPR